MSRTQCIQWSRVLWPSSRLQLQITKLHSWDLKCFSLHPLLVIRSSCRHHRTLKKIKMNGNMNEWEWEREREREGIIYRRIRRWLKEEKKSQMPQLIDEILMAPMMWPRIVESVAGEENIWEERPISKKK